MIIDQYLIPTSDFLFLDKVGTRVEGTLDEGTGDEGTGDEGTGDEGTTSDAKADLFFLVVF